MQAFSRTTREEGVGALYKGLAPNILRGMSMNVGMLACYDQAKEVVAVLLGDPMTGGPSLPTKLGSSCVAVSLFVTPFWATLGYDCSLPNSPTSSSYLAYTSFSKGFTAALFSLPFDVIKSRLMAQKPDFETGKYPYSGVVDCTTKIFKNEGVPGFFRGFSAYYGRCAPHAMIILLSIESISQMYRNTFQS
jgi:solute carrier family 25 oxoglutarate transporter 11